MSRIVESLYRISGVYLTEDNNQYKIKNIYQKLPSSVELKDGEEFISDSDGLNGEYAFKEIYIPFDDYEDASNYCKQNNISKDFIVEEDNGDIYVIETEKYQCWLKGHFYDYEVNQYEGSVIHNTFDYFPIKMKDVFIPLYDDNGFVSGSTNELLLDAAKTANKNRAWPSNVGITRRTTSSKSLYEIIKVK